MGFDSGLKKFSDQLKDISDKAKELDGQSVPLTEVMTDTFISQNTTFETFDSLINKSGFKAETQEDFDSIPDEQWDQFIAENTNFSDWQEMINDAGAVYAQEKLGF